MWLREGEESVPDSGVDLKPDPVAVDLSLLTEYQPNGDNFCFIHNWGIGTILRYLREDPVAEPGRGPRDRPETVRPEPAKADWRCPPLDEQNVVSIEHKAAVRPAEPNEVAGSPRHADEKNDCGFPEEVVRAAWRRQGGRCAGCGRWLIWAHHGRESGIGAWQSHHRVLDNNGSRPALSNCVILCSGAGDCHFRVGHGGIGWSHYAPLEDSALLYLSDGLRKSTVPPTPVRPKRSLLRQVLGFH